MNSSNLKSMPSSMQLDPTSSYHLESDFNSSLERNNCAAGGEKSSSFSAMREKQVVKKTRSEIPKIRQDLIKWNGWGFKDSKFVARDDCVFFTGHRYAIGEEPLPHAMSYFMEYFGVTKEEIVNIKEQQLPKPEDYPEPCIDASFLAELETAHSVDGMDRLMRSHGSSSTEIYRLRCGNLGRIPDIVCWPESHEEVVSLVRLAVKHNVVILPFGGGTSVSDAVGCPETESRTIMSLDTSQMNRILWVDAESLVACVESGIVGQDLERELQARGFTVGHEPDSYEFSTVGGWVSTRASGMKKNTYGNIEDLVVHVKLVTPSGVLEKGSRGPRTSTGPDFNHLVMGSEGTLGVVTEVILKIRPVPEVSKHDSVIFPDFESGVACIREITRQRCQPASLRLMDNEQLKFGQSLRPASSYFGGLVDGIKKTYLTRIKGFNVNKMCIMTLKYEGAAKDVAVNKKRIDEISGKFAGLPGGEANGKSGFMMTYVIAYTRDMALDVNYLSESIETSVPWDKVLALCKNVEHVFRSKCKDLVARDNVFFTLRISQVYDAGCLAYFYLGFPGFGLSDPLATCELISSAMRDEVLASGGCLSHHHGVGKEHSKWMPQAVSAVGVSLFKAIKQQLDPTNVFANGNFLHVKSHM